MGPPMLNDSVRDHQNINVTEQVLHLRIGGVTRCDCRLRIRRISE